MRSSILLAIFTPRRRTSSTGSKPQSVLSGLIVYRSPENSEYGPKLYRSQVGQAVPFELMAMKSTKPGSYQSIPGSLLLPFLSAFHSSTEMDSALPNCMNVDPVSSLLTVSSLLGLDSSEWASWRRLLLDRLVEFILTMLMPRMHSGAISRVSRLFMSPSNGVSSSTQGLRR
ncbi:hypothetical protein EJ02DRAFT_35500 [Clathrospora elynae]|uniref:Uncharacterized protein n=1 Tax=Clathrospora elynae TaxID=706981 RepID=A0A6A5SYB6_9PLEO|nr:hypothetical protein EJ02DRAFT_35500 [Clathrospora elynae]